MFLAIALLVLAYALFSSPPSGADKGYARPRGEPLRGGPRDNERGGRSGCAHHMFSRAYREALMKPVFVVPALLAFVSVTALTVAQPSDEASLGDLQRLQEDLANLDGELAALEPEDPKTDQFRKRAERIREETIYLKVKMEHHQRDGGSGTGLRHDEVAQLRRSIGNLRDDMDRAFRREQRELRLEEGTSIQVRLAHALSSRTARREDRVDASVVEPVHAGGVPALPAGTQVRGVVRDVERAQRPSKAGRIEIEFDSVYLDRTRIEMRGRVAEIRESGSRAEKAGIGAVVGGVLGGILGGKEGAIAGILIGGGGAVVATKGEDVELPAGTVLTVRLERPLVITR